jgi:DNA polymerase type B, organellar and viral
LNIYFDTEDNSHELAVENRSGFEKICTQIAAIAEDGERFYLLPKVTGSKKTPGGFTRYQWDVEPFLRWLRAFGPHTTVFAHNVAYDIGNLWPEDLDKVNVTLVGGRMISAKWENCTFKDSFNIWPMSLRKLGKSVGLEKLDFDPQNPDYLWRDVEIVQKAMEIAQALAESYSVDLPSTLGGLCVRLWQAMGGANWHCALEPAREAYFGGRTEIFAPEMQGPILYTDVNSLYPACMTQPFPDAAHQWFDLGTLDEARRVLCEPTWDCWGVADVTLDIPRDTFVAPLPCRMEDGAVWYPTGRVSGWWTVHEIREAFQKGASLVELRDCYGSLTATRYYERFVRNAYHNRMDHNDEGYRLFWKLAMNNLYGQIGQTGKITRSVSLAKHCARVDGELIQTSEGVAYGTKLLMDLETPLSAHVNWLHAAYVTSYGRLALMRFLDMIPKDDLVYCDTDSVFFRCRGEAPFPISMELGEMKLEDKVAWMVCKQPKMYRYQASKGVKTKAKGVPAREGLQDEFFDKGQATFHAPYKFRESVSYLSDVRANQISDLTRVLSVWRKVTKEKRTNYDKKDLRGGRYFPKFISH